MEINETLAQKVLDTIGHGLVRGLGKQKHGKMCVEAAVCYAMGLPHSDKPTCVGGAVRAYKITINDSNWSNNMARAKGMKRVAIAQLGSESIDQLVFAKRVAVLSINRILAKVLRDAALESDALKCEKFTDFEKIEEFFVEIKKSTKANANANAIAIAIAIANANADELLTMACEVAVQALQEQDCEGCKFLYLCDI
jgi:hypothetical protein